MKGLYYELRSEGLTNTHAHSFRELVPTEYHFRLYCNNPYKCAKGNVSKRGALIIKNLSNPHKHKCCPTCGDTRILVMPVG